MAKCFLKEYGWPWRGYSSRKYFYTLGHILDYLKYDDTNEEECKENARKLWDKKQKIVYLMPSEMQFDENDKEIFVSISLLNDIDNGHLKHKEGDPLAECVSEAMVAIFAGSTWRDANDKN